MEINVILASNERYMPGCEVAAASVAVHALPDTHLKFHVFTEGVVDDSFAHLVKTVTRLHPNGEVLRHEVDEKILAGLPYWAGSRVAAVRCKYAELLPDVDWALYLDCDVLYLASPEEHYSFVDDTVFAVVTREQGEGTRNRERAWILNATGIDVSDDEYFNSGILLLNLKKMRNEGICGKLLEFFAKHSDVGSPDQDALNALFVGKTKIIPAKWNFLQIYLDDATLKNNPVIHYVMGVPWLPKLGVTANGRFRLWHAFADKYVWQCKGESITRFCGRKIFLMKLILYYLLSMPIIGWFFAHACELFRLTPNADDWRFCQTKHDVHHWCSFINGVA